MYRYSNGQISLADFKQPVGMNLKESNRWVKKAQTIPPYRGQYHASEYGLGKE